MSSLVQSDRWRDGGSISAVISDCGEFRSFWLQTKRWDHPRDAGHEHLFVSRGSQPEAMQGRIAISSVEEFRWLDYLLHVDDRDAEVGSRETFRKLIDVLRSRQKIRREDS